MRRALVVPILLVGVLALDGCGEDDHRVVSAPWELRSAADPGATVLPLTVYVGSSTCEQFQEMAVEETADTVIVTARVRSRIGDRECTSDMRMREEEVVLTEPLGGRTLEGCGELPGYPGEPRDCLTPSLLGPPTSP